MKHILYSRPDGGVSVCIPSQSALRWMSTGGRWHDERRGFVDEQIERHIAEGHAPDLATRYCNAMAFGGLTEAEALAVIRDRDCRDGTAHELIDPDTLPDRWFRSAWRRSHNGGPIYLDIEACREQQWSRVRAQAGKIDRQLRPRPVNLGALRDAILTATEPDEIRRILVRV